LLEITHTPGAFVKPHEAAACLADRPLGLGVDLHIDRVGLILRDA